MTKEQESRVNKKRSLSPNSSVHDTIRAHKPNVNQPPPLREPANFRPHENNCCTNLRIRFCRHAARGHRPSSCVCDELQVSATSNNNNTQRLLITVTGEEMWLPCDGEGRETSGIQLQTAYPQNDCVCQLFSLDR